MGRTGIFPLQAPPSRGGTATAPAAPSCADSSEAGGKRATNQLRTGAIALIAVAAVAALAAANGCGGDAENIRKRRRPIAVEKPPPQKTLNEVFAEAAETYYALMRALLEHDREATRKSSKAEISRNKIPLPRTATGLVIDRMNVVVPRASIMVTSGSENNVIGRARADQKGRFEASLFATSYRDLTLHAVADGYEKWVRGDIHGGIQDYVVRLDQKIDERLLKKIAVTRKPEERLWMLLELIGARELPVKIEQVFPYIGTYRLDLLRVIATRGFHENDSESSSPAARALELLAYWHDPEDIPMIRERLPKKGYTLFKKVVIYGKDPSVLCRMWEDAHFAQSDIDPRPPTKCSKPRFGPDETRALVVFAVFEPYRAYRHLLAMVNYGNGWELRLVKTGQ